MLLDMDKVTKVDYMTVAVEGHELPVRYCTVLVCSGKSKGHVRMLGIIVLERRTRRCSGRWTGRRCT